MSYSSMLLLHIAGGTVGLLSGAVAMSFRKGSRAHGTAGNVFFISMLTLGSTGAYLGVLKSQTGNVIGGAMTCYLVTTAWSTARLRDRKPGALDWMGMLFALAVATLNLLGGVQAALNPETKPAGAPIPAYFISALIALLCAGGDLRLILRGGITGTKRVVRHLWRMCFAWFVASGSIFLARPHLFPVFMRKTYVLVALGFLPLILMIYWLVRVRLAGGWKHKPIPHPSNASVAKA